jgi:hypothetical protein
MALMVGIGDPVTGDTPTSGELSADRSLRDASGRRGAETLAYG